ncbi:enoyl-ACP reductase FabV [Streptomyces sp. NPDC059002]|uniref:enoyl-ACP reductase FabV n=1 Tax=Streptomyces sp. NPDC059002 TaxID=3346690 RepID=UPI0036BDE911
MIIEPMTHGSLCVNAHPDGCARRVRDDIAYVRARPLPPGAGRPRSVLVIGGSAGLGLATRLVAAVGLGAATLNVCRETPGSPGRTGSPGWYNTAALEGELARIGRYGRTVVGDAFSDAVKERTARAVRDDLGQVDLVVHSLAAPRRTHPETGRTHRSAIKPLGAPFTAKTYDSATGQVGRATLEPASDEEVRDTVAVMGGDDWRRWLDVLGDAGVLAPDVTTVAFSYVGNTALAPTYRAGTLGRAKEDLEATARALDARLGPTGGRAVAAVMRAMVTQASRVIPAQTLYTVVLGRVMRERGLDEGPVAQAHRLLGEHLYPGPGRRSGTDELGRLRLDDRELSPDVQAEVDRRLALVDDASIGRLGDPDTYHAQCLALNGFGLPGVDYSAPTDPVRDLTEPIHVAPSAPDRPRSTAVRHEHEAAT